MFLDYSSDREVVKSACVSGVVVSTGTARTNPVVRTIK
jgi:hypothetical protein